jgi:hypothetical protein
MVLARAATNWPGSGNAFLNSVDEANRAETFSIFSTLSAASSDKRRRMFS